MTETRRQQLLNKIKELNVDAFLIENTLDIFYLTNVNLSAGTLLATANTAYLIVDGRYFESCKNTPGLNVLLKDDKVIPGLLQDNKIQRLGIDSESTTISQYEQLKQQLPQTNIEPLPSPVKPLRYIKDLHEVQLLRQAAHLGSIGYDFVVSMLEPGITEMDVAKALEIFWLSKGGEGLAFQPIIAFGSASALPHYRAGKNSLKENDIVLIDIGVKLNHYHSDMTRVHFFGEVDPELRKIYSIVKTAQEKALQICKDGVTAGELDNAARSYIASQGYDEYFTHSLGHGIGLEIHESPFLRSKPPYDNFVIKANMAITIEPGIYLPGLGGVRLENTVIVTPSGYEDLTKREL